MGYKFKSCPCGYKLNIETAQNCFKCGAPLGQDISPSVSSLLASGIPSADSKRGTRGSNVLSVPRSLIDPGVFSLQTYNNEITQIFELVRHSTVIQGNDVYCKRAGATTLFFQEECDEVNAFATDDSFPDVPETPPFVVVEGGLCNASKFVALALAASVEHKNRNHLLGCIQWFGAKIRENGCFPAIDADQGYKDLGLELLLTEEVQRKARSYFSAMILHVSAHELGHICLSHTLGRADNLEVSRNQEREADSFASSVLSTTPYSDYNCHGASVLWMVWTWVEEGNFSFLREATTHPLSRERLIRLISDNASQLSATGITVNNIDEYLPKKA